VFAKKRGFSRKPGPPVHDDLVNRYFTSDAANSVWLTDLTEHPTGNGKLYVCEVKDVWLRRIVGYSINDQVTSDIAVCAINNAVAMRGISGTIVHSSSLPHSWQPISFPSLLTTLTKHGLIGSMGRVGACADNAAMESFFCHKDSPSRTLPLQRMWHLVQASNTLMKNK